MKNNKNFTGIYYSYFAYGFLTMLINSILPYLSLEYKLVYSQSGTLLSVVSLGSLVASVVGGIILPRFGKKKSVVFLCFSLVLGYFGLIFSSLPYALFIFGFFVGLGLGSINYFSNLIIGDATPGEGKYLSYLHMFFAVGAFLTPLFAVLVLYLGYKWQAVVIFGIIMSFSVIITFIIIPINEVLNIKKPDEIIISSIPYYKNPTFYSILVIFFLYVGAEQSINGWLVTYLQDENIVTPFFAQILLSVFWVVIIIGRFVAAFLSTKTKKSNIIIICAFMAVGTFAVFLFTKNSVVATVAVVFLGFFCSPIYPLTLSSATPITYGNPKSLTILMVCAGLGAAFIPYVVGVVSDRMGIVGGMLSILLTLTLVLFSSLFLKFAHKGESIG